MPFQLTDNIDDILVDNYTGTALVKLNITEHADANLTLRAKRIFRSRKYNPKRSVEARFNSKPGRPRKLKQVSA